MAEQIERVSFWDGERFVIAYKNCTREFANEVLRLLAGIECTIVPVGDAEAEPLHDDPEPVPVIPENMPAEIQEPVFRAGKYAGRTPEEILETDGDHGYANLMYLLPGIKNSALTDAVHRACGDYFRKKYGCVKEPADIIGNWNGKQVTEFFRCFGTLLTDEDKKKITKGKPFDEWLESSKLMTKKSAIRAVILKYAH